MGGKEKNVCGGATVLHSVTQVSQQSASRKEKEWNKLAKVDE
jgi:hypothetical protein